MPIKRLKTLLDENNVKYVTIIHSRAYAATEVAEITAIPGRQFAKTVMINKDGKMAMAVLPSTAKIDFDELKEVVGSGDMTLAAENEFKAKFPECEPGAMPPFGNIYGMEVFVDDSLSDFEEIAFNAGSHTEAIRMPYKDFEEIVRPVKLHFTSTLV